MAAVALDRDDRRAVGTHVVAHVRADADNIEVDADVIIFAVVISVVWG
jgi:hypothetical protein